MSTLEVAAPTPAAAPPTSFLDPATSRLLRTFAERVLAGAPLPATVIHPDDHMWRFALDESRRHREGGLFRYFNAGHDAAAVLERILRLWFPDQRRLRLLDFACGFGRVTRFLIAKRTLEVEAADIFPQAVEFQRRQLGVTAWLSSADPEQLPAAGAFDCIFVASLFSHLPPDRFSSWICALHARLAPGGCLIFSTLDRAGRADRPADAEPGPLYERSSEIPELSSTDYGVAWVTESFVRAAVERAVGPAAPCARIPNALWCIQDLYVVGKRATNPEPSGFWDCHAYVEQVERSADGRSLDVAGWAFPIGCPRDSVRIESVLDGDLAASSQISFARADVARHFGASPDTPFGWKHSLVAPSSIAGDAMVSIAAVANGERRFLHLGSVEGSELHFQLNGCEDRVNTAERTLATMRSSRFWKMRNLWWKLRGGSSAVGP